MMYVQHMCIENHAPICMFDARSLLNNGLIYFPMVCSIDPGKKTPKEIRRAGLNAKYSVLAINCASYPGIGTPMV